MPPGPALPPISQADWNGLLSGISLPFLTG